MLKPIKPESSFDYEPCPEGSHVATLWKIINIGTVETEWQGNVKWTPKVRLYWELPDEPKTYEKEVDGKKETVTSVFSISSEYTLTMGERAKLRPIIVGMVGRKMTDDELWDFDVETLLGKSCILNVTHETGKKDQTKTYANVASTSPLLKGMSVPKPVNKQVVVDVATSPLEVIEAQPDFIKEKMRKSQEWVKRTTGVEAPAEGETLDINPEDIPF
jgi:hypothetical protein